MKPTADTKLRRPRDPRRVQNAQPRPPRRNPLIKVDRLTHERTVRIPVYEPDEYPEEEEDA